MGVAPWAGLISDTKGTFYGTASGGGGGPRKGSGTVFSVDASGRFTVLHVFKGTEDGASPYAGLVRDASGNLYGVTSRGGTNDSGIVFKVNSAAKKRILHSFGSDSDGTDPMGGLVMDKDGNLYGTTYTGGDGDQQGIVFKIDSSGRETILYAFTGGADGAGPQGDLIRDDRGNLYGTTSGGGPYQYECGTVFQLDQSGTFTTLHAFKFAPDGCFPVERLFATRTEISTEPLVRAGFSTAEMAAEPSFKLSPSGKETVLHRFAGGDGGWFPRAGLLRDSAGNFYGTTFGGGYYDKGMVFKFTP